MHCGKHECSDSSIFVGCTFSERYIAIQNIQLNKTQKTPIFHNNRSRLISRSVLVSEQNTKDSRRHWSTYLCRFMQIPVAIQKHRALVVRALRKTQFAAYLFLLASHFRTVVFWHEYASGDYRDCRKTAVNNPVLARNPGTTARTLRFRSANAEFEVDRCASVKVAGELIRNRFPLIGSPNSNGHRRLAIMLLLKASLCILEKSAFLGFEMIWFSVSNKNIQCSTPSKMIVDRKISVSRYSKFLTN